MDPSVAALFEFTRSRVTDRDISDFSPADPGYPDYVRLWTRIRQSGDIPRQAEFDLSEVIGLTRWADPATTKDPGRFRIFRRFTSAVAVALLHFGNPSDHVGCANYLARDLIIDLAQDDRSHLDLLRAVFPSTRSVLIATKVEWEYPFFTFGEMILAQLAGDYAASEAAASQLIADDQAVRSNDLTNCLLEGDRFLLGLTGYYQLHDDWLRFAGDLKNPTAHQDTQLVIDAIIHPPVSPNPS